MYRQSNWVWRRRELWVCDELCRRGAVLSMILNSNVTCYLNFGRRFAFGLDHSHSLIDVIMVGNHRQLNLPHDAAAACLWLRGIDIHWKKQF